MRNYGSGVCYLQNKSERNPTRRDQSRPVCFDRLSMRAEKLTSPCSLSMGEADSIRSNSALVMKVSKAPGSVFPAVFEQRLDFFLVTDEQNSALRQVRRVGRIEFREGGAKSRIGQPHPECRNQRGVNLFDQEHFGRAAISHEQNFKPVPDGLPSMRQTLIATA